MTRALYQWLLWLHPPRFRREFAGEMLWIFESSVESEGTASLFSDAFASLARQWLLRSGSWKIAVALAGAILQVGIGSIGMLFFTQPGVESFQASSRFTGTWSGSLQSQGVSTPVELVFGRDHGTWLGLFTTAGQTTSIRDFKAARAIVTFHIPDPAGDLLFRGHLADGKLTGAVTRAGAAQIAVLEVARPTTDASAASFSGSDNIDTKRFAAIAGVIATGLIVAVVLLALWTRRFLWARMAATPTRMRVR